MIRKFLEILIAWSLSGFWLLVDLVRADLAQDISVTDMIKQDIS